jgi:hypothetical protein
MYFVPPKRFVKSCSEHFCTNDRIVAGWNSSKNDTGFVSAPITRKAHWCLRRKRKRHLSFSQITPNSENGIARASMTTSCLKGSKRQRMEMTGAMDSSKQSMHECGCKKSTASASPRCRSTRTQQVGFGRNRTIDFDSSLPACFIGLHPVERWSSESLSPSSPPNSQRRTICDTVPRLPTRDTLPRPPIRVVAIKVEALVLLAASSHDLL